MAEILCVGARGKTRRRRDDLAREEPLEIRVRGRSVAVSDADAGA